MVVESIIKPEWIEKNSLYALPIGFCLSVIGISIGAILFRNDASLVGILFTTIAGVPFLRNILKIEELKDENIHSVKKFFLRNKKILEIYLMFFFGITLSYILLYLIMPDPIVNIMFGKQLSIFSFGGASGSVVAKSALFNFIVVNNIKILILCLVLSLLYGSGAIMILTWNASVFGIFLVTMRELSSIAFTLPHALLEFSGFFIAAVGGGIISVAVSRDKLLGEKFQEILTDSLLLFLGSVVIIVIAALVEVNIGVLA